MDIKMTNKKRGYLAIILGALLSISPANSQVLENIEDYYLQCNNMSILPDSELVCQDLIVLLNGTLTDDMSHGVYGFNYYDN